MQTAELRSPVQFVSLRPALPEGVEPPRPAGHEDEASLFRKSSEVVFQGVAGASLLCRAFTVSAVVRIFSTSPEQDGVTFTAELWKRFPQPVLPSFHHPVPHAPRGRTALKGEAKAKGMTWACWGSTQASQFT